MTAIAEQKRVCVLGSTGSVGVSTLSVILQQSDRFQVFALTAHSNIDLLMEQCRVFHPKYLVVTNPDLYQALSVRVKVDCLGAVVMSGSESLNEIVSHEDVDIIVAGIVGAAGLDSIYHALCRGKRVLVANKEPLVMAGDFLVDVAKQNNATILPIDSEHNAIFQCLSQCVPPYLHDQGISKILLTASGGPFLNTPIDELKNVSVSQAIKHPKWEMGRKISIDSATMMNKGLEVIEAHYLFAAPVDTIEVVVHPQSIVHSMVQYVDGSTLAQLAYPDMRVPIGHALNYPHRVALNVKPLCLEDMSSLQFQAPDFKRFPCLLLAYESLTKGRAAVVGLNAINEVVVAGFLDNKIRFSDISILIESVMTDFNASNPNTIEEVFDVNAAAREFATEHLSKFKTAEVYGGV